MSPTSHDGASAANVINESFDQLGLLDDKAERDEATDRDDGHRRTHPVRRAPADLEACEGDRPDQRPRRGRIRRRRDRTRGHDREYRYAATAA